MISEISPVIGLILKCLNLDGIGTAYYYVTFLLNFQGSVDLKCIFVLL